MGKLDINYPIFSEDFKGKISFIGPMAIYCFLKMNGLSCVFVLAIPISLLFLTDWLSSIISSTNYQSGILFGYGFWWIYVIFFVIGFSIAFRIDSKIFYRKRKFNKEGDKELLGDVEITHRFIRAKLIKWHYIETGPQDAETLIFLHGLPESWWCWNNQIRDLAKDFHIYAFDLKGYGQSDKKIGDYRWEGVMEEFVAVLDKLEIEKANFVCHDRGSVLVDFLGGTHPERVLRFVRGQQVLHKWTILRSPQENMFIRPIIGTLACGLPRITIPGAFARWYSYTRNKIPRKEIKRAIFEYSYPKIRWAVPRYFRSNGFAKEIAFRKKYLLKNMTFPVLLLEAGLDPFQPSYYFKGYDEFFHNAQLKFLKGAGHFWTLEKPKEVTQIIKDFLRDMKVK